MRKRIWQVNYRGSLKEFCASTLREVLGELPETLLWHLLIAPMFAPITPGTDGETSQVHQQLVVGAPPRRFSEMVRSLRLAPTTDKGSHMFEKVSRCPYCVESDVSYFLATLISNAVVRDAWNWRELRSFKYRH